MLRIYEFESFVCNEMETEYYYTILCYKSTIQSILLQGCGGQIFRVSQSGKCMQWKCPHIITLTRKRLLICWWWSECCSSLRSICLDGLKCLGAASPCQKDSWVHPSVQRKSVPGQPEGAGLLSLWWGAEGGSWCWEPPELWLCALESSRYTGRQCWSCGEGKETHPFRFDMSSCGWLRDGRESNIQCKIRKWTKVN